MRVSIIRAKPVCCSRAHDADIELPDKNHKYFGWCPSFVTSWVVHWSLGLAHYCVFFVLYKLLLRTWKLPWQQWNNSWISGSFHESSGITHGCCGSAHGSIVKYSIEEVVKASMEVVELSTFRGSSGSSQLPGISESGKAPFGTSTEATEIRYLLPLASTSFPRLPTTSKYYYSSTANK